MKRLPLFLFLALCGLAVSLAFGWWDVYQTKNLIEVQQKQNQELVYRNAALQAEIQDLKSSQDAVQERARLQLGMIKRDEVFAQVMDQPSVVQPGLNSQQPAQEQSNSAAANTGQSQPPAKQASPTDASAPNKKPQ